MLHQGPIVHAACAFTLEGEPGGAKCPHCRQPFELLNKQDAEEGAVDNDQDSDDDE
jgi:hypothetical protein